MRLHTKPLIFALALALGGAGTALAQTSTSDDGRNSANRMKAPSYDSTQTQGTRTQGTAPAANPSSSANSADHTDTAPTPKISGDDAVTPGAPGAASGSVSSSPGSMPGDPGTSSTDPARILNNGTPPDYRQGGANGMGNTGGMTTGPAGAAGFTRGAASNLGSGVILLVPAPDDGAMSDDAVKDAGAAGNAGGNSRAVNGTTSKNANDVTSRNTMAGDADEEHGGLRNKAKTKSQAGADKSDAQNSQLHRTDEPFRDDVGRIPGANPETKTNTSTSH